MKPGDTIQVRQHDVLHDALPTIADPPIVGPGPLDSWIYATVHELLDDVGARVVVNHPGNRVHGQELFVQKADIRTKADVEALAQAKHSDNAGWNTKLQQHYKTQAELLT